MGIEFLPYLLTAIPGTVVYHLLVLLGLLSAAGIVLTEWRHTHSDELKPYLIALGGTMAIHLCSAVLAPFHLQTDSLITVLSAPFMYAGGLLSILLLVWAFGWQIWERQGKMLLVGLLVGWGVLFVGASVLWYMDALHQPLTYNAHSWQVPMWYALSAIAALGGAVIFFRARGQAGTVPAGLILLLLGMGALLGLLGSQVLGPPLPVGEGLGRLCALVGYPLFAISLYRSALQDLASYRQDLHDLSEEALRQSQELLFLIEATRSIGERLDLRGMLGQVADSVAMALRADAVAILLTDQDNPDVLQLGALYRTLGVKTEVPQQIALKDYPNLKFALRRQQLVFGPEEEIVQLRTLFELLGVAEKGPLLIQPLARQERVMGVLVAYNAPSKPKFTSEQELLATTIAVQIAGAVENHRLYAAVAAQAQELSRLLKAREAELRREDAILESMAEGILVMDARGCCVVLNQVAERILGVRREDVLGKSVKEILSMPALNGELDPEILVNLRHPFETTFNLGDQRIRVSAAPVLLKSLERLGVVAVLQDITREYLAEQSKREFVDSISHELRTPLTAIKGYTEVMLSGMAGELPPAFEQFLSVIRENSVRMASLTDNIISVAEIEKGRVGLHYQKVQVPGLVRELISRYRERIEERMLTVDTDLPTDLPPVEVDPNRLRLILDNLLSNAIKFTYPDGRIIVGCRAIYGTLGQPTYFSIWVSDTGIGIPLEEQALIWERFYRVENPLSLEAGGLGIGLTITKALVEAHSGRVWVDSTPGQGSTFTVLMPIRRGQGVEEDLEVIV
ncbi:MAG TPA: ATP-binding protein [Anaerolineae bacterium]|nr:ATP-binding protein [Anaerolineae bacterium]HQI86883.1 ATP-binding protein [Anaerolineae bacterium]